MASASGRNPAGGRRAPRATSEASLPDTALSGTEVVVEKLIAEGNALGHLADGRVVILQGALPGDRVTLERAVQTKGLVRALAHRISTPSPLRVTPECPVFSSCGGCDWMMLRASEQPAQKLAVLREALLRTAKIDWTARPIPIVSAASPQGYRRRIRLQVVDGHIGFYARGSHQLVEPEQCRVSSAALNRGLQELRQLTRRAPAALASVSSLELREGCDGTLSLYLEREPGAARVALDLTSTGGRFQVAVGAADAENVALWQRFDLTEQTYLLAPPGCFTQVHWQINRQLIGRVLAGARARGATSFLDAYAGCGNFALPLLAAGLAGKAIESHPLAIRAATEAARRQALPSAGFLAGDSAVLGRQLLQQEQQFDLVLLDPPRAGVKQGLAELAGLARGWLVMCSCNPVTLARDLRALVDLGFVLEEIEAFDMFPETHHLETLVWLRAPGRAGSSI